MDIKDRCKILKRFYEIYDEFVAGIDKACRKYCATCCTCNVTATTLEGLLVYEHLSTSADSAILAQIRASADQPRFRPAITINEMAHRCSRGEDIPDETGDPGAGSCPWLKANACSFYKVRPFGCRAMVSTMDCAGSGTADMPEYVLSVNNLFMQYIEALDIPGFSGNMIDIMHFLKTDTQRQAYTSRQLRAHPDRLLTNRPVSILMIPPQHHPRIRPLLQTLQETVKLFLGKRR